MSKRFFSRIPPRPVNIFRANAKKILHTSPAGGKLLLAVGHWNEDQPYQHLLLSIEGWRRKRQAGLLPMQEADTLRTRFEPASAVTGSTPLKFEYLRAGITVPAGPVIVISSGTR